MPEPARTRYNGGMEIQPLTIEAIFKLLQQRALESRTQLIVEAQIVLTHNEARLLNLKTSRLLETIAY